jgi:hypothetical protein
MLQCAQCRQPVSPWAARCSQCGHSCEDATEVADEAFSDDQSAVEGCEVSGSAAPSTLDRSPPRDAPGQGRRWNRRPLPLLVAAIIVVAGLTVAAVTVTSTGTPAPGWIGRLSGTVVTQTFNGSPVTSAPDGTHQRAYPLVPLASGQIPQYAAAPDGRLLMHTTGYPSAPRSWSIINVGGDTLIATGSAALLALHAAALALPAPFADHDQALAVVNQGFPASQSNATILSLADGRTTALGPADAAAGDPQSFGAFVSAPVAVAASYLAGTSDVSVQLRDAGQVPVTLATAAELDQDVGQVPSTPVDLRVYPDPTGDKLAVLLNPPTATVANVPMVILDRHGHLLAARSQAAGPAASAHPAWSPDGRLLAYPTNTSTGTALAIQSLNRRPDIYQLSNPNTELGNCVWAPTNITVVCLARTGFQTVWDFANTATRTLNTEKSIGFPIVWLPPPGANPRESSPG